MTELYFRRRFCGPPGMANGGFACGSIAALHGGAAEVTLRLPLPLERPLAARHDGHGALLVRDGDTLLAESGLAQDTVILLGRMTVSLAGLPRAGDQCRVVAWPSERDCRKLTAGSALLGPGDEVLAAARAVWVTVPRPVPALAAAGGSS